MLSVLLKQKAKDKKSLRALIDEFIAKNAKKNFKNMDEFLKSLRVFIWSRWDKVDKKILKELSIEKLKELDISYDTNDIDAIYEKMAVANSAGIGAKFVFDRVDLESVKAMKKMFYWSGTEYNKKVEDKLKDIIQRVFEGEIPRAEVAKVLEKELDGVLKGSKLYFEGVADHIINQAQNVSAVVEGVKYGVEYFKVMAVMDNRTTKICRSMNGRIIPAKHLRAQADKLLNAKSIQGKKDAAVWKSDYHFGKLPSNFGLPPYHFRCRTMVQGVSVYDETIDGKRVYFSDKDKDDKIVMIDNTGVQRRVKKDVYDKLRKKHNLSDKNIIGALNSIEKIGRHTDNHQRFVAKSGNYFISFEGEKVVSMFVPTKKGRINKNYFKENVLDKSVQRIKKWIII